MLLGHLPPAIECNYRLGQRPSLFCLPQCHQNEDHGFTKLYKWKSNTFTKSCDSKC